MMGKPLRMVNSSDNVQFEYILFDLDETLYPVEAGLMAEMIQLMEDYMTHTLGIPADDVRTKRRRYAQKYGTTLRGLLEEYHIRPAEYLSFVHAVNPADFFGPSPPLDNMLRSIPLSKVIFTNADRGHCERVLNTLQVRHHFETIIDIETMNYRNKPDPQVYIHALEILQTTGDRCIMVDDLPRNLIPAKNVGMTTILINGPGSTSPAIDYKVPTVFHVERIIRSLLPDML